jgi:hypothetical protein
MSFNGTTISTTTYSGESNIDSIHKLDYKDNDVSISRDISCRETLIPYAYDKEGDYCTDYENNDINVMGINDMPIYRYKFTQNFMEYLFHFSKVHQYDDRHSFKEAWANWIEENKNLVENEIKRLTDLNYDGNIEEKMFKSARYYYRKKGTEKNAPVDRRHYVCSQKELLAAMDEHIQAKRLKPSDGFTDFCQNNIDLLKTEVNYMVQIGFKDSEEIKQKIKKTYKNRYFLIVKH